MKDFKNTIGYINQNPLNIRFSPMNAWKNQIGCRKGFCMFSSFAYGYRAGLVLIENYFKKGYDTIEDIINRWAPVSENPTQAYIDFLVTRINACYGSYNSLPYHVTATTRIPQYSENKTEHLIFVGQLVWFMSAFELGFSDVVVINLDKDVMNLYNEYRKGFQLYSHSL